MMTTRKRSVLAGALLLLGAAGCVDLDVVNENNPEADRALRLPGDVESLIAGSYAQWWNAESSLDALGPLLSVQSFQHSAFPANFGMYYYSEYPRAQVQNNPAIGEYIQHANPWSWNYRGLSAIRSGLISMNTGQVDLQAGTLRARAFAKFMQGLHHGSLAMVFDKAFILDEKVTDAELDAGLTAVPYPQVMTAALAYLDSAILLSGQVGAGDSIPAEWMSRRVGPADLIRLANSYKARFRASVARTPAERAAVNWAAVLAETGKGMKTTWSMNIDFVNWSHLAAYYETLHTTWAQQSYQIIGMADQSGKYQTWINMAVSDRHPDLGSNTPFTIITPDNRFPQGATLAAQRAAPGRFYQAVASPAWARPDRGRYRWSYYGDQRFVDWRKKYGDFPIVTPAEMRLLAAEALFRTGQLQAAADSINVSRVAAGLNPTNAAGLNTSCVPKLPNGACGDLFEMLKWEKRLEVQFQGSMSAPWYFDSRGWGDLYKGTELQFPMPCRESQVLKMECYTFGGVGGQSASPGSSYKFPGE